MKMSAMENVCACVISCRRRVPTLCACKPVGTPQKSFQHDQFSLGVGFSLLRLASSHQMFIALLDLNALEWEPD